MKRHLLALVIGGFVPTMHSQQAPIRKLRRPRKRNRYLNRYRRLRRQTADLTARTGVTDTKYGRGQFSSQVQMKQSAVTVRHTAAIAKAG